ncbi:hypothetical protein MU582_12380 [Nocardioidaceae bacterium SCSIO 66511]|nr:hypothetical protein MU582_12380 [Nocardioidaceae bacterium SCSIO 66511]
MKRFAAVAATSVLALGGLTACGGSDDEADGDDYCGQIENAQSEFDGLESEDTTIDQMSDMGDKLGDIADAAPDEISSEWKSLSGAVNDMVGILEDADVATDKPLSEAVTEAVTADPELQTKLTEPLQDFQSAQSDVEKVQDHAQEECDIELGDSE